MAAMRKGMNCSKCKEALGEGGGCLWSHAGEGWYLDGELLDTCPLENSDIETTEAIGAWNQYRKGFLGDSGGWFEQSSRYCDYIELLESDQAEAENEATKG